MIYQLEETLQLVEMIESTGVVAIGVHGRYIYILYLIHHTGLYQLMNYSCRVPASTHELFMLQDNQRALLEPLS